MPFGSGMSPGFKGDDVVVLARDGAGLATPGYAAISLSDNWIDGPAGLMTRPL